MAAVAWERIHWILRGDRKGTVIPKVTKPVTKHGTRGVPSMTPACPGVWCAVTSQLAIQILYVCNVLEFDLSPAEEKNQRGIKFPKCYSARIEHQDLTRRGDGKPTRSPLSFGTPPCRLAVAWRSLISTILKPMRKYLNRFAEVSPTIVAPNHLSLYGSQKS